MTTGAASICFACARFRAWDEDHPRAYCKAFPLGIRDDIIFGGFDHRLPHEGDGGVRFELDPARQSDLDAYERIMALVRRAAWPNS